MVRPNQNIIHSSAINLEYESKASASRCNILIESIFNSQILPELEKAISKNIPQGMLIELSKLEINIGSISEKEITTNLASKIGMSLEDALQNRIKIATNSFSDNLSDEGKSSNQYLIESLEIFLQKGYFPFETDESLALDDLITRTIGQNKNNFLEIIKKYSNCDAALNRIVYNISTETLDLVLKAFDPVNFKWIVDYRKILINAKKEGNIHQLNADEFLRTMNFFILKYMLNETGPNFIRKNFSDYILEKLMSFMDSDRQIFSKALEKYTFNTSASAIITEKLLELNKGKSRVQPASKNGVLTFDRLIILLNSGGFNSKNFKRQFLRDEIIQVIQNKEKRELLGNRLNKAGAEFLIDLFYPGNQNAFIQLISSFTTKVLNVKVGTTLGEKNFSYNELVFNTVLYLTKNAIRKLTNEEFVLFLIYSAGLDKSKTLNSETFRDFRITEKNLDTKKMLSLNHEEQQYPEILNIQKILSEQQQLSQSNNLKPDSSLTENFINISKRKIIASYLSSGILPNMYDDLSRQDVQILFSDLLLKDDDFLAKQFRRNKEPENLIIRLNSLITDQTIEDLEAYLIHYFKKEYRILTKLLAESKQHFNFKSTQRINIELFISALARSKGGALADVFIFSVIGSLNNALVSNPSNSAELIAFLNAQSENFPEVDIFQNNLNSHEELQKVLEQNFKQLTNKFHFIELGIQSTSDEVQRLIKSIAFYFQIDQIAFLDILQKNHGELLHIFILLKFYLPQQQWNQIEQSLISRLELKHELEIFQKHSDAFLGKIRSSESELEKSSEELNQQELVDLWQGMHNNGAFSNNSNESDKQNATKKTGEYFSFLKFYAHHGFFPWWSNNISFPEIVSGLNKIRQIAPDALEDLFKQLESDENIFERLMDKIPNSGVLEFDQILTDHKSLRGIRERMKKRALNANNGKLQETSSIQKVIYFSGDQEILNRWKNKDQRIERQIKEYLLLSPYFYFRNINPTQWRKTVYEFSVGYYGNETVKFNKQFHSEFLKHLKRKHSGINWIDTLTSVYQLVQKSKDKIVFPNVLIPLLNIVTNNIPLKNTDNLMKIEEVGIEVKVNNAGLILFWPFLTRLFEILSLVKNGNFINPENRNRAVYILQHLVFNEINFPEYELVLNKLLVGMPSQDHLDPFITLTEEEIDSTKSLLRGLMNNWEKVKDSSPEGIQETFLQREGMLRFQEDRVTLVVLKKGVDVLMNSIPWNISLIKLSWMKKPIYVEWI